MSSSSTTAQPEELHLHIKKPATATNATPKARCRNCTAHGKPGVDSRWICDTCPKQHDKKKKDLRNNIRGAPQ